MNSTLRSYYAMAALRANGGRVAGSVGAAPSPTQVVADQQALIAANNLLAAANATGDLSAISNATAQQMVAQNHVDADNDALAAAVPQSSYEAVTTNPWFESASMIASAYHGYRRNDGSVGWALGWSLLAGFFPVATPALAAIEGFGKPKK